MPIDFPEQNHHLDVRGVALLVHVLHCSMLTFTQHCRFALNLCLGCRPQRSIFHPASCCCTMLHAHHASWMHKDVQAALVSTGCTRPYCLSPPPKLLRQDVYHAGNMYQEVCLYTREHHQDTPSRAHWSSCWLQHPCATFHYMASSMGVYWRCRFCILLFGSACVQSQGIELVGSSWVLVDFLARCRWICG